jgi:membrane-associated phospholipid phosphatase
VQRRGTVVPTAGRRRPASRVARFLAVGCALPLLVFVALSGLASQHAHWDAPARRIFVHHVPLIPGRNDVIARLVLLAFVALAATTIAYLLLKRRLREAACWLLAVAGVHALDPLLKDVIQRPPPSPFSVGYAYPSGHAMISMAVIAALVLTVPPRWRLPVSATGLLVAVAYGSFIVASQSHYPSDVLGGWCISTAWVAALWLLISPARQAGARASASRVNRRKLRTGRSADAAEAWSSPPRRLAHRRRSP